MDSKLNRIRLSSIAFVGSIIELTAKYMFDYGRLPNPIERLAFDWVRLNFGSIMSGII